MVHKTMAGATVAVVLLAIVAGLLTAGGPGAARREKLDLQRFDEIAVLARRLDCHGDDNDEPVPLPEILTAASFREYCGGSVAEDQLTDNESGDPYAYRRLAEFEFEICAEFYDAARMKLANFRVRSIEEFTFDPETGCIRGQVN